MHQTKIVVLTLVAAAALGACGGGDAPPPGTASPAAALVRERAQAVTPEDAARQLLDFAEGSAFKIYFPSHPETQTFGPFRFRYYPATGVYLGVVVAADATYGPVGAVYVMGGPFGAAPTKVGLLTDFITPVDTGGGGGGGGGTTGANNGCYDLAIADTPGTRGVVEYRYSGRSSGTGTVEWTVGALTAFEGSSGYETVLKNTDTLTSPTPGTTVLDVKTYSRRAGDAEVTNYGSVTSGAFSRDGLSGTLTTKSVYTPPWASRVFGIPLGGTLSETSTMTISTTFSVPGIPIGLPPTTNTSTSTTVTTYAANETITVPAGTYSTCRFDITYPGSPAGTSTTQWVLRGKGIPVKIVSKASGSVDSVQEATSITLNGSRL